MRTLTKDIRPGTMSALLERFNVPTLKAFRQKFNLTLKQSYDAMRLYQGVHHA